MRKIREFLNSNIKVRMGIDVVWALLTTSIVIGLAVASDSNRAVAREGFTEKVELNETDTTTEYIAQKEDETTTEEMETQEHTTKEETTTKEPETETQQITQAVVVEKPSQNTVTNQAPSIYTNADISAWIKEEGNTVITRFQTPEGYDRLIYNRNSFAGYIQNLQLKPYGSTIHLADGTDTKEKSYIASVIKTDFPNNNWLQCADCVIKLLADYMYENKLYEGIRFNFLSGYCLKYNSWASGNRVHISGGSVWESKDAGEDYSVGTYKKYLNMVYQYANTSSLKRQADSVKLSVNNIFPGAYFIMDADYEHSLGHAIFVVDVAKNEKNGDVAFLLAQGSTPSCEMSIMLNPLHPDDPWFYASEIGATFKIPGWTFKTANCFYFKPIGIQNDFVVDKEDVSTEEITTEKIEDETTIEEETTTEESTTEETITEEITTAEEETTTEENTTECENEGEETSEEDNLSTEDDSE